MKPRDLYRTLAVFVLFLPPAAADVPVSAWTLGPALASIELESPAARAGHRIVFDSSALTEPFLRLPLPDGEVLARLSASESREHGRLWRGHMNGDREHPVTLTLHKGQLAGYLSLPEGSLEIVPERDGTARLLRIDHERFPACDGGEPAPTDTDAIEDSFTSEAIDGSTDNFRDREHDIDVVIFYSQAARNGAGGTAQIETTAQAAVDAANTSFAQSGLEHRFTLTGALLLSSFTESGDTAVDLPAFRSNATAIAERNARYADMAGLLFEGSGSCGRGYLMTNVSGNFANNAFQITLRTCAVGNLTYAHEHGHNMGMAHNPENAGSAAYPFSYGHWDSSSGSSVDRFRTVMSYANPCTPGCTRRPYFSNPDVLYRGQPTGIANQRDNARNTRQVGPTVANFRTKTIFRHDFD